MTNKIPMTIEGLVKLKKKLLFLKNNCRPKIINTISIAREHGDLKENSEYQTAKNEQLLLEKKINEIEYKLNNAIIIDKLFNNNTIIFGSKIKLLNLDNNKIIYYTIVGKDEANYKKNKISYDSPLAKGLIGKIINETIIINVPKGILNFKILNII